jgi:hypothetical protein
MNIETFNLDGEEYILVDEIDDGENYYMYFKNDNVPLMVRKLDKNDEEYIIPLDDTKEVLYAVSLLNNKI